jgi:transcriptional regulator with XRE-family HTH domain
MQIGIRFKQIRTSLGLNQEKMAEKVGVTKNSWQSYELEATAPGTNVYLKLIEDGFSVDWILSGKGDMYVAGRAVEIGTYTTLQSQQTPFGKENAVMFNEIWLENYLGLSGKHLSVATNRGDDLLPEINDGAILILDTSRDKVTCDGIYLLEYNNASVLRRIEIQFDGTIKFWKSQKFSESFPMSVLDGIKLGGRVVWAGKKI